MKRDQTPNDPQNPANESEQAQGVNPDQDAPTGVLPSATANEFCFEEQAVRTVTIDGAVWFVVADVCEVLGLRNPSMAVARLDEDEKGLRIIETPGGYQEINVVNESGLYALILTSRKPQAKAFRRWVTGEVLPAVRATGRYETQAEPPPKLVGGYSIYLTIPGRYIVFARTNGDCDVRRTDFDVISQEMTSTDVRILAHHASFVAGLWNRRRMFQSMGVGSSTEFSETELDAAITKGLELAEEYLLSYPHLAALRAGSTRGNA
jgi:hypothetical protein